MIITVEDKVGKKEEHVLRVGVEKARVQELREVGNHPQIHERADIVRRRLAELLAVDPLRHVHPPRGPLRVVPGDDHLGQHLHLLRYSQTIFALQHVIQLLVEATREFVDEVHHVQAIREELGQAPQQDAQLAGEV